MWSDKAKSGGGSTTEGTIVDYEFMDRFPFGDEDEDTPKKGKKAEAGENIYMLLSILPEGADEGDDDALIKRSLYLGSSKFLVIEEDGKVLKAGQDGEVDEEGTPKLYSEGDVYRFVASLEDAGFPAESRFPDPSEDHVIDLRPMIGTRVRCINEVDEALTKKLGKVKGKGKNKGKEFNRTVFKVAKVLGLPDEDGGEKETKKSKSAPGKAVKEDTKAAKKTSAKGKAAEEEEDEDGEDEDGDDDVSVTPKQADKVLKAILGAEKTKKLAKFDLAGLKLSRYAAKNEIDKAEMEAIRKMFNDDDYFEGAAERGVIEEFKGGKKPVIELAA